MPLAPNALTTVRKVKKKLGIPLEPDENMDEDLEDLINAASDYIEKFCNRKFGIQEYTERVAGNGMLRILLRNYPVVSVQSVMIDNREVSPDLYDVSIEDGILYKNDGWPGKGFGIQNLSYEVTEMKSNIKVRYTAGYVLPKDATEENPRTLPYDLEQACLKLVALYYNDRNGDAGILSLKRETIGDYTGEYQLINPPNDGTEKVSYDIVQTLLKWRRIV